MSTISDTGTSTEDTMDIAIYYDGENQIIASLVNSLQTSLNPIAHISLHEIDYRTQLHTLEHSNDIEIYSFSSTIQTVYFQSKDNAIPWEQFLDLISHRESEQILAMGNTDEVANNTSLHTPSSQTIDAKQLFMYVLWEIKSIAENEELLSDDELQNLEIAASQFFADNINDMITGGWDSDLKLGEPDFEEIAENKESYKDENPVELRKIPRAGYSSDQSTLREIDPSTGEVSDDYGFTIAPDASIKEDEIKAVAVPALQSAEGPSGAILNSIFNALSSSADLSITASKSAASNMTRLLQAGVGGIEGNLSKIIDNIIPFLPIPEEDRTYYDLIFDIIRVMSNDYNGLNSLIDRVVELFLPENDTIIPADDTIGEYKISNILYNMTNMLSIENRLGQFDTVSLDTVASLLQQQYLGNISTYMLNSTRDGREVSDEQFSYSFVRDQVSAFLNLTISHLTRYRLQPLENRYIPTLLNNYGVSEENSKKIFSFIRAILVDRDLNKAQNWGLKKELARTLKRYNPDHDQKKRLSIANKAIKLVTSTYRDISNGEETDFSALWNKVNNKINAKSGNTDLIKNLLQVLITMRSRPNYLDSTSDFDPISFVQFMENVLQEHGVANEYIPIITKQFSAWIMIALDVRHRTGKTLDSRFANHLNDRPHGSYDQGDNTQWQINDTVIDIIQNSTDLSGFPGNIVIHGFANVTDLVFRMIENKKRNAMGNILNVLSMSAYYTITPAMSEITDGILGFAVITNLVFGRQVGRSIDHLSEKQQETAIANAFARMGIINTTRVNQTLKELGWYFDTALSIPIIQRDGFSVLTNAVSREIKGMVPGIATNITESLNQLFDGSDWNILSTTFTVEWGMFNLVKLQADLNVKPNFAIDKKQLQDTIQTILFNSSSLAGLNKSALQWNTTSFFKIEPIISGSFEILDLVSLENDFLNFLLNLLAGTPKFDGQGSFEIKLFEFRNGQFGNNMSSEVLHWQFDFTMEEQSSTNLFQLLTNSAGGNSLSKVSKHFNLVNINFDIEYGFELSVVKTPQSSEHNETGTLTLGVDIGFSIGQTLNLVAVELTLKGSLEAKLTFISSGRPGNRPLDIYLNIGIQIKAVLNFRLDSVSLKVEWSPPGPGIKIFDGSTWNDMIASIKACIKAYRKAVKDFDENLAFDEETIDSIDACNSKLMSFYDGLMGLDQDSDGLSDRYEAAVFDMDQTSNDTDDDGLTDLREIQQVFTDPRNNDTDGDGLEDGFEFDLGLDPLNPDSDFDGLSDGEEILKYETNALAHDTDGDGLSDRHEVTTVINTTGITPSVDYVTIGGRKYDDRTDPLNKDTDGDGLLDGKEGFTGPYYGDKDLLGDKEDMGYEPDDPLIFNNGYTSPLDNDTDDDSYTQLVDGSIAPVSDPYIRDMSDFTEVKGIEVVFVDPDTKEPQPPEIVRTNPVMPDTDHDSEVEDRSNPPIDVYLNSDGAEIARDPPTDPLDGDTDNDGLIDGIEGLSKTSNHTDPADPDTDGDGLGDLLEVQKGFDPRSVDTDLDGVVDSDEFFTFGTSVLDDDTDNDGISDSDELYLYHSDPFVSDTDGDSLSDYDEIYTYNSDPVDEDSDNDFLNDFEEIKQYRTNPRIADTDGDKLLDGEEIEGLEYTGEFGTYYVTTDPNNWDTDSDSIVRPDGNGSMSQSMSDYEEYQLGTDPTKTDTDGDNIKDSWEVYLGSGKIPNFDPIPLDALSNDTDDDGISDGTELRVANISTLLYPYRDYHLVSSFNTSAVSDDTDNDGVSDRVELDQNSNPQSNDTDGDGLSDYDEIYTYNTSAITNDTDGDNLSDYEEINGFESTATGIHVDAILTTDPLDSDTDDDMLPDGAEVNFYQMDPTNSDMDGSGVIDGLEIDTDGDGLSDGHEYYSYTTTQTTNNGGPFNPDSDGDGLFDGFEINVFNSSATAFDTDGDGFGDGIEQFCDTDPRVVNTEEDMESCLGSGNSFAVISPTNSTYKTKDIPVVVYDFSGSASQIQFSYSESGSSGTSLAYNLVKDEGTNYWRYNDLSLPKGNTSYELTISAMVNNSVISQTVNIDIITEEPDISIISPAQDKTITFSEQVPTVELLVSAELGISSLSYSITGGDGTEIISNQSLVFDESRSVYVSTLQLPRLNATYNIGVEGEYLGGNIVEDEVSFTIQYTGDIVTNTSLTDDTSLNGTDGVNTGLLIGGVAVAVTAIGAGIFVLRRRFTS